MPTVGPVLYRCCCRAAVCALLLATASRADLFDLTEAGLAAIRENQLLEPIPHAGGKGWFIEGYVVIPRDAADQPALPYPARYFMFRPMKGAFKGTDVDGRPKADAREVRLEFAWTRLPRTTIDTLDDVRGLISNRDLRYGSGNDALEALVSDIDPDGALQLKRSTPAVVDTTIFPREGLVSEFLIYGPKAAGDRQIEMQKLRARPPSDPLGFNPLDIRGWSPDMGLTLGMLLTEIARCDKWGEPEPGVRASCFAVARFMTERIYVDVDNVAPSGKGKALRVSGLVQGGRRSVMQIIGLGSPGHLAQPVAGGLDTDAHRLVTPADDLQPVTCQEEVKAALEVAGTWTPRGPLFSDVVAGLLQCAGGRADYQASSSRPLPGASAAAADAAGRQAFGVLAAMGAAPTGGVADTGAVVRRQFYRWVIEHDEEPAATLAARDLFCGAGMADDAEIEPAVTALIDHATNAHEDRDDVRRNMALMLKHVAASVPDKARRARYQGELDRQIEGRRSMLDSGSAGPSTRLFLDVYDKTP